MLKLIEADHIGYSPKNKLVVNILCYLNFYRLLMYIVISKPKRTSSNEGLVHMI